MVRKVVDHRIAGDSEWLINRTPLQSGYFKALKQYFLSNLITNVPVYTCLLLATFGSRILDITQWQSAPSF
jgi:hypothetical protein